MNLKYHLQFYLLLSLLPIVSAHADAFDNTLTEARTVFLQAVDGDKRAVRDATKRFKKLSHNNPQEPVLLAYLGACTTLQGRDALNNINKRRLTEEGLDKIDRALNQLADNKYYPAYKRLDTMLVAASSYIHIPAFFNRHDKGKQLLAQILDDQGFDGMVAGFKAATYMAAALISHGDNDKDAYRRYLDLIVKTDPNGRDGRLASEMIKEL